LNSLTELEPQFRIRHLVETVNPYEYIFTKIPNSKVSTSKMNTHSNTFYDFMEIANTLHLFLQYEEKDIYSLHIGKNNRATIECLNFLREDKNDRHMTIEEVDFKNSANTIEFIYYELEESIYQNKNEYILALIKILCNLLYLQKTRGASIIKVADIYYKPIVEFLYLISIFYEKVYIIKPSVSNVTTNEKYLVCKFFVGDLGKMIDCYQKLHHILELYEQNKKEDSVIQSFIKNDIPYNFICKLEECNIILGQQQVDVYDQMIHIMKTKNKEDRMDLLRKNNIQKCIHWCEKYKIPYNKFNENKPSNIFLPLEYSGLVVQQQYHQHVIENLVNSMIDKVIYTIIQETETMCHNDEIEEIQEFEYVGKDEMQYSTSTNEFPVFLITPNSSSPNFYEWDEI